MIKGYTHEDCGICGTEIGFSEVKEMLPNGKFRCSGCVAESEVENENLKSLLRELLPLIKALPEEENAIELIGAGLELSNPVTLRDYIERIREAVK